jgi:uncharacterized protein
MAGTLERQFRTGRPTNADRELLAFLAATFVISWGVGVGGAALLGPAAYLLGVFGPALAAVWASRHYEGTARGVWIAARRWRTAPRWYVVSLLLPLVLVAVAFGAVRLLGGEWELDEPMALPMAAAFLVFAFFVAGGPEEVGWRGYALPRLQSRWNALVASLVLGGIWALWHAPLWFLSDLPFQELSFPLYATQIMGMSVVYTWLYNATRGSVLLAMVLHASHNLAAVYLATTLPAQAALTALWLVVALALVARYGSDDLARTPRVDREQTRRLTRSTAGA